MHQFVTIVIHEWQQLIVDKLNVVIIEFNIFVQFNRIRNGEDAHDLSNFWLRKTRKPVLAVLMVKKKNGEPRFYRGTNMEVSMPTGSLCAERNVIGSALADDLSLRRQDLKYIAVYSGQLESSPSSSSRIPESPTAMPLPATPTLSMSFSASSPETPNSVPELRREQSSSPGSPSRRSMLSSSPSRSRMCVLWRCAFCCVISCDLRTLGDFPMLPPSAAPPLFPSFLDSSAPSNSRSSSGGGGVVRNRQISRTVHMSSSDNSLADAADTGARH